MNLKDTRRWFDSSVSSKHGPTFEEFIAAALLERLAAQLRALSAEMAAF